MDNKDFITKKLKLIKADKQQTFHGLVEPLAKMLDSGKASKVVMVPADGNWFKVSFDAVQVRQDRLVISAERDKNGMKSDGQYKVTFKGTRAAYLYGFCQPTHKALHHLGYKSIYKSYRRLKHQGLHAWVSCK